MRTYRAPVRGLLRTLCWVVWHPVTPKRVNIGETIHCSTVLWARGQGLDPSSVSTTHPVGLQLSRAKILQNYSPYGLTHSTVTVFLSALVETGTMFCSMTIRTIKSCQYRNPVKLWFQPRFYYSLSFLFENVYASSTLQLCAIQKPHALRTLDTLWIS